MKKFIVVLAIMLLSLGSSSCDKSVYYMPDSQWLFIDLLTKGGILKLTFSGDNVLIQNTENTGFPLDDGTYDYNINDDHEMVIVYKDIIYDFDDGGYNIVTNYIHFDYTLSSDEQTLTLYYDRVLARDLGFRFVRKR